MKGYSRCLSSARQTGLGDHPMLRGQRPICLQWQEAAGRRADGGDNRGGRSRRHRDLAQRPAAPLTREIEALIDLVERRADTHKVPADRVILCGVCGGRMLSRPRDPTAGATSALVARRATTWPSWPSPSTSCWYERVCILPPRLPRVSPFGATELHLLALEQAPACRLCHCRRT